MTNENLSNITEPDTNTKEKTPRTDGIMLREDAIGARAYDTFADDFYLKQLREQANTIASLIQSTLYALKIGFVESRPEHLQTFGEKTLITLEGVEGSGPKIVTPKQNTDGLLRSSQEHDTQQRAKEKADEISNKVFDLLKKAPNFLSSLKDKNEFSLLIDNVDKRFSVGLETASKKPSEKGQNKRPEWQETVSKLITEKLETELLKQLRVEGNVIYNIKYLEGHTYEKRVPSPEGRALNGLHHCQTNPTYIHRDNTIAQYIDESNQRAVEKISFIDTREDWLKNWKHEREVKIIDPKSSCLEANASYSVEANFNPANNSLNIDISILPINFNGKTARKSASLENASSYFDNAVIKSSKVEITKIKWAEEQSSS